MIPYVNVAMIAFLSVIIGLNLGSMIFDRNKHDDETEVGESCTKSHHLFRHDDTRAEIYCFCGNEVMRPIKGADYYLVKR